ncbi:hypothetical protein ONS95_012621 [Cadophora gregata]|uniref:uncharacterized protein n=1 Tax=Cadophora gregata TaxID=51156 RepID=UPI0026DDB274|nr:uncharacterized protein ONS95_012621 [Cadophora gregata]KAK0118328.1 hypothetical protein ONS95_012621 [Cadophora gregata]KAK0123396.1 hypothetical protein ONS96_010386 [Cadophora gregata f. sp. sojae]
MSIHCRGQTEKSKAPGNHCKTSVISAQVMRDSEHMPGTSHEPLIILQLLCFATNYPHLSSQYQAGAPNFNLQASSFKIPQYCATLKTSEPQKVILNRQPPDRRNLGNPTPYSESPAPKPTLFQHPPISLLLSKHFAKLSQYKPHLCNEPHRTHRTSISGQAAESIQFFVSASWTKTSHATRFCFGAQRMETEV